ncbi:T9SS type A sorting domain-containing protein [Chryseobacterium indoltheticum]
MSGKIASQELINNEQENINLSSYTKGICYIIQIKTDKDVITKKVIKE